VRNRPATEIEVTPEMATAGARILEDFYDALPETAEEYAAMIFRTMAESAPSTRGGSCDGTTSPNEQRNQNLG